jgi:hypothetical protein
MIDRGSGKHLPVPDKHFCIVVDPHSYPYNTLSRVDLDCFLIPQTAPRSAQPQDYPATLQEIEQATNLSFFQGWGRDHPIALSTEEAEIQPSSGRLAQKLEALAVADQAKLAESDAERDNALVNATSIDDLIDYLSGQAAAIQTQGRALTDTEMERVRTLQHSISWLLRARDLNGERDEPEPEVESEPEVEPPTLITYHIASDVDDLLKQGGRTACNFWNRYLTPERSIVIRLGVFTQNSLTIARAYHPYEGDGTVYGRVEFNTKYLTTFSTEEIAGTIVHEIGHTLGMGWERWQGLFDGDDGRFTADAIAQLDLLEPMHVELDGGPGTRLSHWDEARYDTELMTGYQDSGEYVLPVTIAVMELLGHTVGERLSNRAQLSDLLNQASSVVFSRQDQIVRIDTAYLVETPEFETIPHPLSPSADSSS